MTETLIELNWEALLLIGLVNIMDFPPELRTQPKMLTESTNMTAHDKYS